MGRTDKKMDKQEILINKAGHSRYNKPDSVEKLIRYIARENGKSKNDLVCCGVLGAAGLADIDITVRQFKCVQMLHRRKGYFGRYIDHEIYSFSSDEEKAIIQNHIPVKKLAEEMALDFYKDGFQVYYGVHQKDHGMNRLHVHFAINTVNFHTGNKRHEYKADTQRRGQRLRHIVDEELRKY